LALADGIGKRKKVVTRINTSVVRMITALKGDLAMGICPLDELCVGWLMKNTLAASYFSAFRVVVGVFGRAQKLE
jgi:hypothetical protein